MPVLGSYSETSGASKNSKEIAKAYAGLCSEIRMNISEKASRLAFLFGCVACVSTFGICLVISPLPALISIKSLEYLLLGGTAYFVSQKSVKTIANRCVDRVVRDFDRCVEVAEKLAGKDGKIEDALRRYQQLNIEAKEDTSKSPSTSVSSISPAVPGYTQVYVGRSSSLKR